MSRGKAIHRSPLKAAARTAQTALPSYTPKWDNQTRPNAPFTASISKDRKEVIYELNLTPKEYMHVLKMIFLKRKQYPNPINQAMEDTYSLLEAAQAKYPLKTLSDFNKLPKLIHENQTVQMKCTLPPRKYTTKSGYEFIPGGTGGNIREIYQGLKYYRKDLKQQSAIDVVKGIEQTFVDCLTPIAPLFKTEVCENKYGNKEFFVNGADSMLIAKAIYPIFENDPRISQKHYIGRGEENGQILWSLNCSVLMPISSQYNKDRLDEIACNTIMYYEGRNQISHAGAVAKAPGVLQGIEKVLADPMLLGKLTDPEQERLVWLAQFFKSL